MHKPGFPCPGTADAHAHPAREAEARALLLRVLPLIGLKLSDLVVQPKQGPGAVTLRATISPDSGTGERKIETAVAQMAADPVLLRVHRAPADEG